MTRVRLQPGYLILAGLGLLVLSLIALPPIIGTRVGPTLPSVPNQSAVEGKKSLSPTSISTLVGQASVIDGDTIEIHGTRIRFSGIDAPESSQTCEADGLSYRCGQKAAIALSNFIGRHTVNCNKTGTDRWRRVIAKCFSEGTDLSSWMVANGWAIAYRKYSMDYVADEERARNQRIGIWAGKFIAPEEWRKSKQNGG